jgi:hypothetical protein
MASGIGLENTWQYFFDCNGIAARVPRPGKDTGPKKTVLTPLSSGFDIQNPLVDPISRPSLCRGGKIHLHMTGRHRDRHDWREGSEVAATTGSVLASRRTDGGGYVDSSLRRPFSTTTRPSSGSSLWRQPVPSGSRLLAGESPVLTIHPFSLVGARVLDAHGTI